MRAAASVMVLLLGGACTGAAGPGRGEGGHPHAAPRDNRPAERGTIAVISARVVSSCGTVGTDLTARFSHECDGRWRCALEGQLAPRVAAITESVTMPKSGRCHDASITHKVNWRCEGTSGEHSLTAGPVARLRLSCPRPDAQADDALADEASQPVTPPEPSAPAASQPGQGTAIHGQLIGSSLEEVAGRTIVVGNQRTSTDRHGRFSLGDVPAVYDLVVIEPDRALMVLYLGLSRRDPVMAHAELPHPPGYRRKHEAAITGRFWGDRVAGDRASVRFLPAEPSVPAYESDQSCGQNMEYSLGGLSWRGRPSICGRLLAGIYTNCASTDYIGPDCALAGVSCQNLGDAFPDTTGSRCSRFPRTSA